jgi:type II secretory pathway pseudopilin PulG
MSKRCARRGITLVEVLVLIVILLVFGFILLALLLPAQSRSREAPRRNQCMNKMKQLALALENYHEVHKRFPATSNQGNKGGAASVWWPSPGSGAATGAIPSAGYTTDAGSTSATAGYSWIVMILPYMDENSLYQSISQASGKFSADAFTPYNVEGTHGDGTTTGQKFSVTMSRGGAAVAKHFAAVQLDEVACPSYSGTPTVATWEYNGTAPKRGGAESPPAAYGETSGSENLGSPAQYAVITNYVALSATHFPLMEYGAAPNVAATTTIPKGAETPNGMIVPGNGLSRSACTDGFSKTLMLCETIEPALNSWYDGTTAWTTGINPNTVGGFPPSKAVTAANPKGFWTVPAGGTTALNVGPSPNAEIVCSPSLAGNCATPRLISWGPSSNHSGGVVVHAAVDGSVHIITPDIDPTVYMRLITIAGGEPEATPDTAE